MCVIAGQCLRRVDLRGAYVLLLGRREKRRDSRYAPVEPNRGDENECRTADVPDKKNEVIGVMVTLSLGNSFGGPHGKQNSESRIDIDMARN